MTSSDASDIHAVELAASVGAVYYSCSRLETDVCGSPLVLEQGNKRSQGQMWNVCIVINMFNYSEHWLFYWSIRIGSYSSALLEVLRVTASFTCRAHMFFFHPVWPTRKDLQQACHTQGCFSSMSHPSFLGLFPTVEEQGPKLLQRPVFFPPYYLLSL